MDSFRKLSRLLVLGLILPLAVLNGWVLIQVFQYFQPLVNIFVLAILLSFILNYPVQLIEKLGIRRIYAVISIALLTVVILVVAGLTLIPHLLEQFSVMVQQLPESIDAARVQLQFLDKWATRHHLPFSLSQLVTQITSRLGSELQTIAGEIFTKAVYTIDSISAAVVVVVLALYLLLDGVRIWSGIFQKLPHRFAVQMQEALQQNFQNYLIAQLSLASLIGFSMTIAFFALKVPFALLFGVVLAIMAVVPFGDIVGFTLISLFVASQNFWLGVNVLVVAIAIDQLIDQAVAPRLLGGFTGLRPLWVLVSLLVGTKILGLLGLITAVPIAGFIKRTVDILSPTPPTSDPKELPAEITI